MSITELDNLVRIGQLKAEPPSRKEFDGLVASGTARLADAQKDGLAAESRFDLAYNASHALALAALRRAGYRSENRFTVFQALVHTTDVGNAAMRVFAKCHNERNLVEYGGSAGVDEQLLADLIACARQLQAAVEKLAPPA